MENKDHIPQESQNSWTIEFKNCIEFKDHRTLESKNCTTQGPSDSRTIELKNDRTQEP